MSDINRWNICPLKRQTRNKLFKIQNIVWMTTPALAHRKIAHMKFKHKCSSTSSMQTIYEWLLCFFFLYFAKTLSDGKILCLNGELIHPNKGILPLYYHDHGMRGKKGLTHSVHTRQKHQQEINYYIPKDACGFLLHTFISSRMDSVNVISHRLLKFLIEKLQRVPDFFSMTHWWILNLLQLLRVEQK